MGGRRGMSWLIGWHEFDEMDRDWGCRDGPR